MCISLRKSKDPYIRASYILLILLSVDGRLSLKRTYNGEIYNKP
ncbi:MAG: hypothetical protein K0S47_4316 [Herbinix sp.]|jgi:hypothetical protein|nr:hypothetical protein [Herbinix sp.]